MSVSSDYKLAKIKIIWSNQRYLLKEFVETFNLPQVVLVKDGYCGEDERTTFGRDQILTLHQLRETNKTVCQTAKGKFILLPSKCEVKAQVLPMNFKNVYISAKQLIETYKKIKYVRVLDVGKNWCNDPKNLLQGNDTLEIKKIEPNGTGFHCKNLSASHDSYVPSFHVAKFVPLSDPKYYTLAEIKAKYGFPAKIWFTDEGNNDVTFSSPDSRHSKTNLYQLEQLTVVGEIQENDVIVTTVCSSLEEKICLNIPTKVDIKVTVAEGFLKGSKTYATVVKTLDKELYKTDLNAFKDLDVYQHVHAVKKHMQDSTVIIREASSEDIERARQQLQKHEKIKTDKVPKLQSSTSSMSYDTTSVAQKSKQKKSKKSDDLPHSTTGIYTTRSEKLPNLHSADKYTSLNPHYYSTINDAYETLQPKQESLTKIREIQKPKSLQGTNSEDGNYAVFEKDFTEDKHSYEYIEHKKLHKTDIPSKVPRKPKNLEMWQKRTETDGSQNYPGKPTMPKKSDVRRKGYGNKSDIQKMPLPPLPVKLPTIIPPNQTKEDDKTVEYKTAFSTNISSTNIPSNTPDENDKEAIYEAISRYPQDLSSLSVADVSRLLKYLGLKDYVETFENEMIDGSMLMTMDAKSLEFLNVNSFYCNKLLRFIGGWRPYIGK
ncbi:uncharacterized protein LOC124451431 [Xenia sp. Carnegie-2017]|uniref:uncharacterized protein LOC124451431 n=1 Tax=Xenia sp. Carnegie-2017 TaxID=2897299 RepID=UPI001F040E24|nr:uncharacterized protein LOC124451431 [Xenia sp. Carnegie-2017]